MKLLESIINLLIGAPLFYIGYCFEYIVSSFCSGRIAYVNSFINDDEFKEFLKWRALK